MPIGSGVVMGTIKDAVTGVPIKGVMISSDGMSGCCPSNGDGAYACSDTAGTYHFTCVHTNYRQQTKLITLPDSQTIIVDWSMHKLTRIKGHVYNADGTPASNCTMTLKNAGGAVIQTTVTDAQGFYAFPDRVLGGRSYGITCECRAIARTNQIPLGEDFRVVNFGSPA